MRVEWHPKRAHAHAQAHGTLHLYLGRLAGEEVLVVVGRGRTRGDAAVEHTERERRQDGGGSAGEVGEVVRAGGDGSRGRDRDGGGSGGGGGTGVALHDEVEERRVGRQLGEPVTGRAFTKE